MARRRPVTEAEALEALGDAITRAIHWAPVSLLMQLETERRGAACFRLALRVIEQLRGDGWAEGRPAKEGAGLDIAIVAGLSRAEEGILTTLQDARRTRKLLDGVGQRFARLIWAAMQEGGARLKRTAGRTSPSQTASSPPA